MKPYLSVVIPVFRSASSLDELYSRLKITLDNLGENFEIIFIDDSGGDGIWMSIKGLSIKDTRVRGALLNRNYGQHNALLAGIRMAKGQLIITMDDDLQHPPEEIPKLISELSDDIDVVYGCPEQERHGFLRNIASRGTKIFLERSMGANAASNISAFRIFKTGIRDAFQKYDSPTVNIDVLLTWGTSRFSAVKVKRDLRKFGKSNYTVFKLLKHALNMIIGFSSAPLKITGFIGFIFSILGFLALGYVLLKYLILGSVVPGFAFLASTILLFSGVQLLALGIIGEYLARMYEKSMGEPTYSFREILDSSHND